MPTIARAAAATLPSTQPLIEATRSCPSGCGPRAAALIACCAVPRAADSRSVGALSPSGCVGRAVAVVAGVADPSTTSCSGASCSSGMCPSGTSCPGARCCSGTCSAPLRETACRSRATTACRVAASRRSAARRSCSSLAAISVRPARMSEGRRGDPSRRGTKGEDTRGSTSWPGSCLAMLRAAPCRSSALVRAAWCRTAAARGLSSWVEVGFDRRLPGLNAVPVRFPNRSQWRSAGKKPGACLSLSLSVSVRRSFCLPLSVSEDCLLEEGPLPSSATILASHSAIPATSAAKRAGTLPPVDTGVPSSPVVAFPVRGRERCAFMARARSASDPLCDVPLAGCRRSCRSFAALSARDPLQFVGVQE